MMTYHQVEPFYQNVSLEQEMKIKIEHYNQNDLYHLYEKLNLLKCSKCQIVSYCSKNHQIQDWHEHKKWCNSPIEKVLLSLWNILHTFDVTNACLATSSLVAIALEKKRMKSRLVCGYAAKQTVYFRHVWVETGNIVVETSHQVRQFGTSDMQYFKQEPINQGLERIDQDTIEEKRMLDSLNKNIKIYTEIEERSDSENAFNTVFGTIAVWKAISKRCLSKLLPKIFKKTCYFNLRS
jgi:hypothetical protein